MKRLLASFPFLLSLSAAFAFSQPDQPHRYAVILKTAPVAEHVLRKGASRAALSTPVAEVQRQKILKRQESAKAILQERRIAVTGSVQTLLNAVFVVAPPSRVAELKAMPDVVAVVRLPEIRSKLNSALDLVNASLAWSSVGGAGNAGAGMKIAILDTGIDETHPGFRDPSLAAPAGFPKTGNADDARHATNKIIAVRSFVSALAIGDGTPEYTRPDDLSARDRTGHGTALAMIAAGVAHQSPLGLISGVAPKAWLGNYKIFGSPGVNDTSTADVALQALEAAFNDGMDVALLSAGSLPSWAPADQGAACGLGAGASCDPWAAAVASAAKGRMVVVTAAGNDGNLGLGTINTPGDSADAITVGASTNTHTLASTVSTPGGDMLEARLGDGPGLAAPISAPLVTVSAIDSTEHGCLGFPQGSLSGKTALIAIGQCAFSTKVLHAQDAGAVAVLLFQQSADTALFAPSGLSNTGIPVAVITAKSGAFLKEYLSAHPGAPVTLDPVIAASTAIDGEAVAAFSSRGPGMSGSTIKPDLLAPGAGIYTAAQNLDSNGNLYSANRYIGVDGTSFAAAIVAGAAALVKQAHPGYTAGQIKSALANSATPGISDRDANGSLSTARALSAGAGKLNIQSAIASNLTAEPVSVAFGAVNSGLGSPRTITITNTGSTSAAVQLTVRQRDADTSAAVSVTPATFNIAAGQSQNVVVALSGKLPASGIYEGAIVVAGGAVPLQIPYLYLVGDGKPYQLTPLSGANFVTEAGTAVSLAFRVMDRYGVPVPNLQVRFAPAASVYAATPATDSLGIAEAYMNTAPGIGDQSFAVDLPGNAARLSFNGRTRVRPQINGSGVVDAASGQASKGYAPGSYLSLFGSGLSESLVVNRATSLPLSLAGVAVSFDVPALNLHVPGRLHFVSGGQINVQIPWELSGTSSASMKVTLSNSESQSLRSDNPDLGTYQSQVITLPIANYSPAFFEYKDLGTGRTLAAALDESNAVVTPQNAVQRGHVIQFFLNGLGPVAAGTQPESGEAAPGTPPLAVTQATPALVIGERPATVLFSGLAPFLVGLYQVNAIVPQDIGAGIQPVTISVGGVISKPSALAVR